MAAMSANAVNVSVSVEVGQEYAVQEIHYDGQEVYSQPPTMSEKLTKLAHKIDFTADEDDVVTEETNARATFQPSLWPWDGVRNKLKSALTEVCVLADVLAIARDKKYLVLDPVSQEPVEHKTGAILLAKKKALNAAGDILLKGASNLRGATQQEQMGRRVNTDFHTELLLMRQSWRLRKAGSSILGDLSYRSAGSRFWQSGTFEVSKSAHALAVSQGNEVSTPGQQGPAGPEPQRPPSSVKISLPSELEGISYIQVTIQKGGRISEFITRSRT